MKKAFSAIALLFLSVFVINAQEKGVDKQSQTIRDSSTKTSGINKGLSSGINWGKDKTPEKKPVPNPFRFTARREAIVQSVQDILRDKGIVLNEPASKPNEGILITQPFIFAKGAELAQSALVRYAQLQTTYSRNWTRGRYTLFIEVQPIDTVNCNVSVTAKIEGKAESASGAEWTTLKSSGLAEEEILNLLITNLIGEKPVEKNEETKDKP